MSSSLGIVALVFGLVYGGGLALASEPAMQAPPELPRMLLGPAPPYVPRASDASIELGLLNSNVDFFWMGAAAGINLGPCVFSRSETCQQYLDGIAGVGIREGETHLHLLGSLRWQYVNFPDRYAPFWRVTAGAAQISESGGRKWYPSAGLGVGVTTFLHPHFDLRFEARTGYANHSYLEGVIGLQVKADSLLKSFALRLKALGYGTVETAIEATGNTLEATKEGLGGIVKGVSAPFRDKKPDEKAVEKPATNSTVNPEVK